MIIKENMSIMEKLEILSDAAKYDVSCSSSGVECNNNGVALVILRLVVYVTASVLMEDVFHCLRYFLPMNVYIIADIVLTGPLMML